MNLAFFFFPFLLSMRGGEYYYDYYYSLVPPPWFTLNHSSFTLRHFCTIKHQLSERVSNILVIVQK